MSDQDTTLSAESIDLLTKANAELTEQIGKVIVGQKAVVEQLLIALFSRGHCLLEGLLA